VADGVAGKNIELFDGILRNLIREGAELDHSDSPGCQTGMLCRSRHDSTSTENLQGPMETGAASR
jgi:hypothetical protein